MSRTRSIAWSLCCVTLFSFSCKESDKAAGGGGRGGTSSAGRSGSIADAGVIDGGDNENAGNNIDAGKLNDAGRGAAGKAGVSGHAGGGGGGGLGMGGAAGADDDAGAQPQSGSGGAGGASSEDLAYDQCLSDAQAAGQHVDDCTRCLCQADKCRVELNIATHDESANAVVICSQNENCTDTCCLCEDKTCGLSNYGSGPCASEVKVAAGVDANSGIDKALSVSDKCAREGDGDNSCRRVAVLAYCELQKCPSECPSSTTCQ